MRASNQAHYERLLAHRKRRLRSKAFNHLLALAHARGGYLVCREFVLLTPAYWDALQAHLTQLHSLAR